MDWRGLLTEKENVVSLGRVLTWAVFALLIYFWIRQSAPPATLVDTFWVLLGYNLGKKFTDPLQMFLQAKQAHMQNTPAPIPPKVPSEAPKGDEPVIFTRPRPPGRRKHISETGVVAPQEIRRGDRPRYEEYPKEYPRQNLTPPPFDVEPSVTDKMLSTFIGTPKEAFKEVRQSVHHGAQIVFKPKAQTSYVEDPFIDDRTPRDE